MHLQTHNVHGVERALSVAAGVLSIASGVYRGGAPGVIKALGGAALLLRGVSGHCSVKGLVIDPETELEYLRQRVAALRAALPRIEDHPLRSQRELEAKVDNAVEETFPASDPISP
ncbi:MULTISPECIES: DUF2892 domain-containing protein [Pseudomonas]|uniref:Inner membrane protein YgaP-like transmembrane domain-containing protein n=1 Tax=Pseudomonas tohonis TaxID=2725477 RepID=A0A6J4E6Y2_9PSED|nr:MULTISPECIES: DUF2892 domain-containing protein [Pseudomonas]UXY50688.1 DUF2892 domain-containing protein [Pseudomonas tohonis]BBP83901.1 hypothetical protein PHLH8_35430 [Pseudomonas sp. Pc102]BCG25370.1 hypothetical protein TUM18999_35610 [Pseudomonas tohonis]GJN54800.1 hypothetical protein TUM20286_45520 [Pseudomonas tohonis]